MVQHFMTLEGAVFSNHSLVNMAGTSTPILGGIAKSEAVVERLVDISDIREYVTLYDNRVQWGKAYHIFTRPSLSFSN